MKREEVISYIRKFSPSEAKTDFSRYSDAQFLLMQFSIEFDMKKKSKLQQENSTRKFQN